MAVFLRSYASPVYRRRTYDAVWFLIVLLIVALIVIGCTTSHPR